MSLTGKPDPARQSLGRPLTDAEQALAEALEAIFGSGQHDFTAVAAALETRGIARPSGEIGPWTEDALEQELKQINDSLDQAYAARDFTGLA